MGNINNNEEGHFKKVLTQRDVWALAFGAIIGWGCFVLPGTSFLPKAGPSAMLGLLIAGIIMSVVSISYAFCIKRYPVSGGEYVFAKATMGRKHAFVCGWMMSLGYWSLIPLNATAIGLITRYLMPGLFQFAPLWEVAGWQVYLGEVLLSMFFIVAIGLLNIRDVKTAGWFQSFVSISLIGSIIVSLVGVLINEPDLHHLEPFFAQTVNGVVEDKSPIDCILAIICFAPYCFVGFDCIPQTAEEYKFPPHKTLKIMMASIMAGAFVYAAVVFITAAVMPWAPMILSNPDWATGEMVMASVGRLGLLFLGIATLSAVLSGMNAFYISGSRLLYSMAKDRAMSPAFGRLHPRFGTPYVAILFMMFMALLCPWFGRSVLVWVVDMTCVGVAVGFTYTCTTAFFLARREHYTRMIIDAALGIVLSAFFIVLCFVPGSPGFLSVPSFIILGIWIAIGVVFWCIRHKKV